MNMEREDGYEDEDEDESVAASRKERKMDGNDQAKPAPERQSTEAEDKAMLDSMRPGNALLEICRKLGLDINKITEKKNREKQCPSTKNA